MFIINNEFDYKINDTVNLGMLWVVISFSGLFLNSVMAVRWWSSLSRFLLRKGSQSHRGNWCGSSTATCLFREEKSIYRKSSNYGASPMKVALELKIFFSTPKSPFGLTSIFRGRLPVRPVLALLHTCANGNVLLLHLPALLHIAAWTSAPKRLAGCLEVHQELSKRTLY